MDRIIAEKFGNFDLVFRETHKVNGLLLRDRIIQDRRELSDGQRLGSTYFAQLAMEWSGGQASFASLKPAKVGESINDGLVQALDCCAVPNPAARTTEPLECILRHQGKMNQTEVYGMVKTTIANTTLGQPARDTVILEIMHYLFRTELAESWPGMMLVHWVLDLNPMIVDCLWSCVFVVASFECFVSNIIQSCLICYVVS